MKFLFVYLILQKVIYKLVMVRDEYYSWVYLKFSWEGFLFVNFQNLFYKDGPGYYTTYPPDVQTFFFENITINIKSIKLWAFIGSKD